MNLRGQRLPLGRLQASGFGETRPVAPDQNPDGTDNPAGSGTAASRS
jgi:OmpA-OmpF porin, OOP family